MMLSWLSTWETLDIDNPFYLQNFSFLFIILLQFCVKCCLWENRRIVIFVLHVDGDGESRGQPFGGFMMTMRLHERITVVAVNTVRCVPTDQTAQSDWRTIFSVQCHFGVEVKVDVGNNRATWRRCIGVWCSSAEAQWLFIDIFHWFRTFNVTVYCEAISVRYYHLSWKKRYLL